MPYRKRRYARNRKKVYRKTRSKTYRKRSARVSRSLPIAFPNKYVCKLNYVQEFTIDSADDAVAVQVFRANDCYDPDLTGAGHQPMGFDELCKLYTRFVVIGSIIKVTAVDTQTSAVFPAYWGVQLTDSGTRLASLSTTELMEQERNSLKKPGITRGYNLDANVYRTRTAKFSQKGFFRLGRGAGRDDQYVFTQAGSPPTGAFYEVYTASLGSQDAGQLRFLAQIQYIVLCYTPLTLNQS